MWLLRRLILAARPLALARNRLSLGPSLAYTSTIFRSAALATISFSALALADLTALATSAAAGDVMNRSTCSASSTVLPLTRSAIGMIFLTDMPVFFAVALAATSSYATSLVLSLLVECPRNVLVGANSPSLCPTMFSVINRGT